jgi:RNA polymerase sigma-70 factor (ECF subfamily)
MIDEPTTGHCPEVVHPEACLTPREVPQELPRGAAVPSPDVRALVDRELSFVWRFLRRLGLTAADADDATQQVFIVAARKLTHIEAGAERAFLFGVAQRVFLDARRAQRRKPHSDEEVDVPDSRPNPEDLAGERRTRHLLDSVLEEMPADIRAAFVLFELEELPAPEISRLLGIPSGTVASRVRRGREIFRAAAARIRARDAFRGGPQ